MQGNVRESARLYFEGYPQNSTVLVSEDGHCFHAKEGGTAKLHAEKAGVKVITVSRKMLEEPAEQPKGEQKPKGEGKPKADQKPKGEQKPKDDPKPKAEDKTEGAEGAGGENKTA